METCQKYANTILNLPSKWFVDLGASCVSYYSQTEFLLDHGFSGLMIECDPNKHSVLSDRYKNNSKITIISTPVTPDNIISILKDNKVPDGFYLSLDIDGYDFFVLKEILSHYRPGLVISEVNEKIPPPIKFAVNYTPNYFWDGSHYYGYSISMLDDLLTYFEYKIDSLDGNNVVLVPGKQTEKIEDVYRTGYLDLTDRLIKFGYNHDFEPIHNMDRESQLKFIRSKFDPLVNERQSIPGHQINGILIANRSYVLH